MRYETEPIRCCCECKEEIEPMEAWQYVDVVKRVTIRPLCEMCFCWLQRQEEWRVKIESKRKV